MLCGAEICGKFTVCKRNISVFWLNKGQKIVVKKVFRKTRACDRGNRLKYRLNSQWRMNALRRYKITMKGEKLWLTYTLTLSLHAPQI